MSRVLNAIFAAPWAITPEALEGIVEVASRCAADPDLIAEKIYGRLQGREPANDVRQRLVAQASLQPLPGAHVTAFHDGVAIVPVTGPIFPYANLMTDLSGATALSTLHRDLDVALENQAVRAILFKVSSPGGAVQGVADFAARVHGLRAKLPIGAHVDGTGASAAYWIAAAASDIAIERTSVVGSIGVATAVSVQEAPDAAGKRTVRVVSTHAPDKAIADASAETLAKVREVLDAVEAEFIGDLAAMRGVTRAKVIADFGAGGVRVGADAVAKGMADRVESFDAALARMVDEGLRSKASRTARRASMEQDIEARRRTI